ncbi:S41 family peptidase [Alkalicoccus chagannorensis]|uniref:S41 family peptidase n=1 Tax=Alkalicoccus chagannorensis TaxID=427072 RepID=UPI0004035863|nr:S41 family peptidase [Alkalicoccus chagannorensis]
MTNKVFIPVVFVLALLLGAAGTYTWMTMSDTAQPEQQEHAGVENEAGSSEADAQEEAESADENASMDKINQAMQMIQSTYINDMEEEDLVEGALTGMIEQLDDPYSEYMNESTAAEFMESLDSSFEGIGAEVSMENGQVTIVAPFRDSPAEDAGLRPNDQIMEVDGEDIEGLSLTDAVLKIRGEKGSTVTLTIDRPGSSDAMDVDVVRDEIPIETVYSDIVEHEGNTIGVLELRSFSENTAERFEEELQALEEEGIDGLLMDVRGNPGGYLQSVEDIGDLIVPGGEPVVQIEDSDGDVMRHVSSLEEDKEYPMAVLINEGSASASEILAAAVNETAGAELIGLPTFGKGTVQQTMPMGDGSQLKLTLFRWLTAYGNDIDEEGVQPTMEVEQPEYFYTAPVDAEEALELDMLNEHIENAQIMLDGLGYSVDRTDGYFDASTEEAVISFQEDESLEADGIIEEETADRLQERVIDAVQDQEEDEQFQRALDALTGDDE